MTRHLPKGTLVKVLLINGETLTGALRWDHLGARDSVVLALGKGTFTIKRHMVVALEVLEGVR